MHQPILAPISLPSENEHKIDERFGISNEKTTMIAVGVLERLFGFGRRMTSTRGGLEQVDMRDTKSGETMKGNFNTVQNQKGGECGVEESAKTSITNGKIPQHTHTPSYKSTAKQTTAEDHISQILDIHTRLSIFKSLKPSPELNALFGELVGLAIKTLPTALTNQIMNDSRITSILHSLRTLCATSECELESHWASAITSLPSSSITTPEDYFDALKRFPYFKNYVDLARMEFHALLGVLSDSDGEQNKIQKVAFIGSGPLPLTSLCLLWQPQTTITSILNIDSNPRAIAQSHLLCEKLGYENYAKGMDFACEEAEAGKGKGRDLREFDVVFLAALVGGNQQEKEKVLRDVVGRMRRGSRVVVRSSHGLRGLLYPEFEFAGESVKEVMGVEVVVNPWGEVVNSVVVGRVL